MSKRSFNFIKVHMRSTSGIPNRDIRPETGSTKT